mgnify:CR=1 FL=1
MRSAARRTTLGIANGTYSHPADLSLSNGRRERLA